MTSQALTIASIPQPAPSAESAFKQRFGLVGETIANTLTAFSLDLCGLVSSYVLFGVARHGQQQPVMLFSFGSPSDAPASVHDNCYGIACSSDGTRIWITHARGVLMFDGDGKFIRKVAEASFAGVCSGIAFGNNEVFVSDHEGDKIVVCSLEGNFIRRFGTKGHGMGQLDCPWGLFVDKQSEHLLVCDRANHRVQVLGFNGERVRMWGGKGTAEGQLDWNTGVAMDKDRRVWVLDSDNRRLQIFDEYGAVLRTFGTRGGLFGYPTGLAFDCTGNVLIVDRDSDCVHVLSSNLEPITQFGQRHIMSRISAESTGTLTPDSMHVSVGLKSPWSIAVDAEGRILVGDGTHGVQVLAFAA